MSQSAENRMLQWALWYARRGWPVLALHTPKKGGGCSCSQGSLCHSAGKHPHHHPQLLKHGAKSATTDPELIKKWWEMWPDANIGIATGKDSFDVLDVDLKGNGPDTLSDLEGANETIPDTIEQITGSGGRQIMFQHCGGLVGNEVKFASGLDTRSTGGLVVVPPSLHSSGNRYEWEASSNPADGKQLQPMPQWLLGEILKNRKKYGGNGTGKPVEVSRVMNGLQKGERDQEIFRYACRLRSLGLSREEAEPIILSVAAKCDPPFPEKDALRKLTQAWKYELPEPTDADYPGKPAGCEEVTEVTESNQGNLSNRKEPEVTNSNRKVTESNRARAERNIAQEVREWLETCDGVFTINDVAQDLQIYAFKESKNNLKKILFNLHAAKVIERVGSVRGTYRKVETALEEANWWDVSLEEYPIQLPLGLTDLVKIMPKSIIVCAGEKNSAKSAFALNVARLNIPTFQCRYFNSEASPEEYKERLSMFDDLDFSFWRKMPMYEKSQNIEDFIFPDDLNIVDFLEIHDEFYKIGGIFRKIHDRLRQGVAVVNLQKAPGTDQGRGGISSAEKARLYIALSLHKDDLGMIYNKVKIVSAKLWRDKNRNPNGLVKTFRVYKGCIISELSEWHYEKGVR